MFWTANTEVLFYRHTYIHHSYIFSDQLALAELGILNSSLLTQLLKEKTKPLIMLRIKLPRSDLLLPVVNLLQLTS